MKKSVATALMLLCANSALANQSPSWDTLAISYLTSDAEYGEHKGFGISGTKLITDDIFVVGGYSSVSDDVRVWTYNINHEYNNLGLGLGFRNAISETTDIYAAASVHRLEFVASANGSSESVSDTGVGLELGIRTMANEEVELNAALSHISVEDESEVGISVGAMFSFTERFGLGFGIGRTDNATQLNATARFNFN